MPISAPKSSKKFSVIKSAMVLAVGASVLWGAFWIISDSTLGQIWPVARQSTSSQSAGLATNEPVKPKRLDEAEFQRLVVPHLQRCQTRIEESIVPHLSPLNELINRAEIRTSRFSEVALSFGSKWRLAKDYVPFTSGGEHESFLRGQFEELVLKSEELEKEIRSVIESFLREMASTEGQMFVDLRADLDDLPLAEGARELSERDLQMALDQAIRTAAIHSSSDFNGAVGQQLVSLIAGEVLAHTAVRMGVSAGILGVGAGSGWATFGVGVVAGVVVDALVSTVWNLWADPELDLTRQIQAKLNLMRTLLLEGDSQNLGLRPRFVGLAHDRTEAIEKVLRELLMETP